MTTRTQKSLHGTPRPIKKKRGPRKLLVVVLVILAILLASAGVALGLSISWLQDLPDYEDASAYNTSEKTKVYASDGTTLLAELYLENREPVTLDQISEDVKEGTVATEDERFYKHNGVDLFGIARATFVNLTGGHEGASTITQQFVRNTVLADEAFENTYKRKVREAYIALKLEEQYSKDEILLMYLNTINYGQGAYGIEAAAQRYFSKPASDVTLAEAATLIGIPQSPTNNNPIDNPDACKNRRNLVLDRMLSNDYITQEEHDAAQAEPLELKVSSDPNDNGLYKYKYFTSYVRDELVNKYSVDEVFKGGMKVITTLDVNTQEEAEKAVKNKLKTVPDEMEMALVAVDPNTGFIRAMVGGKDYDANEYNLATQAHRQPGSSFKTFTLLSALNKGISPKTYLNCTGHVTINGWKVENYDGTNYGTRTIESAFAISSNTGFAQLVTEVGPQSVVDMAHTCGIETELDPVPSITLGAEVVTVREMAQAYATIANGGTKHEAVPIYEVYGSTGKCIYRADTTGEKVLSTELTQAATEVMKGVVTRGTGMNATIANGQTAAGKTGTSENWRDRWFCGITPQLSVAIWTGTLTEKSLEEYEVSCDDVFGRFMSAVLRGQETQEFPTTEEQLEYTIFDIGSGSGENSSDDKEETKEEKKETTTTTTTTTTTETPATNPGTTNGSGQDNQSAGGGSGGQSGNNSGSGTGGAGGSGGSGAGGAGGGTGGTGG